MAGERDLPGGDDGTLPDDEVTTGNPYHLSRVTRIFLRIVALVLVITMTAFFVTGVIHW